MSQLATQSLEPAEDMAAGQPSIVERARALLPVLAERAPHFVETDTFVGEIYTLL